VRGRLGAVFSLRVGEVRCRIGGRVQKGSGVEDTKEEMIHVVRRSGQEGAEEKEEEPSKEDAPAMGWGRVRFTPKTSLGTGGVVRQRVV
jgi:hypothetical protein